MATTSVPGGSPATPIYRRFWPIVREGLSGLGVTGLGLLALLVFLLPLGYVLATAFKLDSQMTTVGAPLWPAAPSTFNYEGTDYPLYKVPNEDGTTRRLALVHPFRESSDMVDPANPEQGIFNVKGRWRTWDAIYRCMESGQFPAAVSKQLGTCWGRHHRHSDFLYPCGIRIYSLPVTGQEYTICDPCLNHRLAATGYDYSALHPV
jgi:hypothetical protein